MKQELVQVRTHGVLGEHLGHHLWNLNIKTVGNALNAIEVLSKRKLFKFFQDNDSKGVKYAVLINGRDFISEKTPTTDDIDSIKNSELCAKIHGLKTIDIIPILYGSDIGNNDFIDDIAAGSAGAPGLGYAIPNKYKVIIAGAALIIVGAVLTVYGYGAIGVPVILAGIGLLSAGVINLLSKPPQEPEVQARQKQSFLFSGPINIANEGGPVPIGYGRLITGSTVVSASYDIVHFNASDESRTNL